MWINPSCYPWRRETRCPRVSARPSRVSDWPSVEGAVVSLWSRFSLCAANHLEVSLWTVAENCHTLCA